MESVPRNVTEYRQWWAENTDVPYGFCWCGCGQKTTLADQSHFAKGQVDGEPKRFVMAHAKRVRDRRRTSNAAAEYRAQWERERPDIPYGFCWCGCGRKTGIATSSQYANPRIKGEPTRYCKSHATRTPGPDYIEEDHGYKTSCWMWQLKVNGYYGRVGDELAHRHYYEQHYGPLEPCVVLHHLCEQKTCVRPDHLSPTTLAGHVALHGWRGSRHPIAKLTEADVVKMRRLSNEEGLTQHALGEMFGVSRTTVGRIIRRRAWAHI